MTAEPSPLHPRARPLSDAGNAERLIDRHGADLRYVPAWGTWLTWSGTHWARDEDGEIVRRCTDTIRAMADEVRRAPDDKTAAKVAAHAMRCEAAARLDAMERLARSHLDVVTGVDQLDDRPWLLACANGTVDLRTGTLRPAARDDLLTRRCPVEHDLDAACLRWETFLAEVLPDPDVRSLVQRAVGYSLTGDVSEHRMLVCHGRGANGKALDDDTPVPTPDGWIRSPSAMSSSTPTAHRSRSAPSARPSPRAERTRSSPPTEGPSSRTRTTNGRSSTTADTPSS